MTDHKRQVRQDSSSGVEAAKSTGATSVKLIELLKPLTATTVVSVISLFINAPYLRSIGVDGWATIGVSIRSLYVALVFVVLTIVAGSLGLIASGRTKPRFAAIIGGLLIFVGAFLLGESIGRSKGSFSPQMAFAWLAFSVAIGVSYPGIVSLVTKKIDVKAPLPLASTIYRMVGVTMLLVATAVVYSLSIFILLPDAFGGHLRKSIRLPSEKVRRTLGEEADHRTPPVWLVYVDAEYYWIEHPSDDKTHLIVTKYNRKEVGEYVEVREDPNPDLLDDIRPKRWLIKI